MGSRVGTLGRWPAWSRATRQRRSPKFRSYACVTCSHARGSWAASSWKINGSTTRRSRQDSRVVAATLLEVTWLNCNGRLNHTEIEAHERRADAASLSRQRWERRQSADEKCSAEVGAGHAPAYRHTWCHSFQARCPAQGPASPHRCIGARPARGTGADRTPHLPPLESAWSPGWLDRAGRGSC